MGICTPHCKTSHPGYKRILLLRPSLTPSRKSRPGDEKSADKKAEQVKYFREDTYEGTFANKNFRQGIQAPGKR